MRKFSRFLLFLLLAGGAYLAYRVFDPARPTIALEKPFKFVGHKSMLRVRVSDQKYGLKSVRVSLTQGEDERVVIEKFWDPPKAISEVTWTPAKETSFRLREGSGKLKIVARNASWASFFDGRTETVEQEFTARMIPPRLEVLTRQHYVSQGGCDMVVYRVTPAFAESGVVVGDYFFRGYALPGSRDPGVHFAIFAFPYELGVKTPVHLRARDEAENESLASFSLKVFPKRFRGRAIALDDEFLGKVVSEIMSQTPSLRDQGDLIQNYLAINRDLRKANNRELASMATRSQPRFLWQQPFKQLSDSQVEAQFADHRTYTYLGREVDQQDHLGFDLATSAQSPVEASNDGLVVLAQYFGIYGNTVVIDHGYSLMSLYGHLSSFAVKAGESVKRGQTLGRTGATGLAGGDHLHFSMLNGPVQVNAVEWWDPHWIEDRIAAKLRDFGGGAPAVPVAPDSGGYVEEEKQ